MGKDIKYSFIMPYIDRAVQLLATLESFRKFYSDRDDYEIILVEDGKNTGKAHDKLFAVAEMYNQLLPGIIHILPFSGEFYNPAPLYNHGVEKAEGKYVAITEPECKHEKDILLGLDEEFEKDSGCCVVCGCVAYDENGKFKKWFQHSEFRDTRSPWCNTVSKELYESSGGFPHEFGYGYAFDDNAFRDNLINAGVPFILRDDLLVVHQHHVKHTPSNKQALWNKNKKLYESMFKQNI